ncbi:MAG: hypothetical protein QXN53_08120 [Thermoproteota archaeon]
MRIKIKNIYCPICHMRTYFTGEIAYDGKRIQVIEWKCSDCGVTIKSRHDKLGKLYNQRKKRGNLSPNPVIWIRKGNYRDFLYFEIGRKLYTFRSLDVERLERDEILAIPVYQVLE